LLFLPIIVLISILIIFLEGQPIFFKQLRVGKNERIFNIYKFRTMSISNKHNSDSHNTNTDKYRISKFGSFLRKLSLDELPQLINIISGDMSFIGPRPLFKDYLNLYSVEQRKRHCVTPGISGLAQVNGRNSISWEKRFKYDIYYVNNQNLFLDLKILILTFFKVICMNNINEKNSASMTPFKGKK
tara:strand:- start:33 stop:590 length:558 start_codon:yes stop_codon:yes gene_type:complete